MTKDGRIFDKDWSHYDFFHVVHKPTNMDQETLHSGTAWLQQQFYSYKNIARRMGRASTYLSPSTLMKAMLALNLGYRFKLSKYGAFQLAKSFQP